MMDTILHCIGICFTLKDIVGIRRVMITRGYVNLRNGCEVAQIRQCNQCGGEQQPEPVRHSLPGTGGSQRYRDRSDHPDQDHR